MKKLLETKVNQYLCKKIIRMEKMKSLEGIVLTNGQTAQEYVMTYPTEVERQIVTEAILECLRLGYPLNNMEITSKGRELNRKRLGIK